MSISITGGVHLGANDGAPYLSLHAQIGTLPTINLDIGPVTALSLTGGLTEGLLPVGSILPPAIVAPLGGLLGTLDTSTLHLGGTVVDLPVVVTNPVLLN